MVGAGKLIEVLFGLDYNVAIFAVGADGSLRHDRNSARGSHVPPAGGPLFPRMPSSAIYDRVSELGPRHLEILELVLSGCTNQEISNSTQLSLGTVKNYVSSLLLALDVRSRSHLISLFR